MIRILVALVFLSGCAAILERPRSVRRAPPPAQASVVEPGSVRTIRDCETPFARVVMSDEQEVWEVILPAAELSTLERNRVVRVARQRQGACFVRTENPSQGDPGDWRPAR